MTRIRLFHKAADDMSNVLSQALADDVGHTVRQACGALKVPPNIRTLPPLDAVSETERPPPRQDSALGVNNDPSSPLSPEMLAMVPGQPSYYLG